MQWSALWDIILSGVIDWVGGGVEVLSKRQLKVIEVKSSFISFGRASFELLCM